MASFTKDVLIVGGFGHVGLPLGIVLADAGFNVVLHDLNRTLRPSIEAGVMPFIEYDAEPILKNVIGKTLTVGDDLSDAKNARILIITIGTPIDEYLNPKTKLLFALAESLLPHLQDGHCILLRSTVSPGTTRHLADFFAAHGKKVHVGNCPERIAQGYAIRELKQLPQILSGMTPEAVAAGRELFERVGAETIEVAVEEAELCKLFLNAWRYIQFAAANEFAMMAMERGLDYTRMHKAMTHKYPRAQSLPRPGFAAGPCLFKDTMQLAAAGRSHFPLGHSAMVVNEGLPSFLVEQLKREGVPLRGVTVGILGMAFKGDIDDIRDSLSYKLRKLLVYEGATALCSDAFVKDPSFVSPEDLLHRSSIVFVGAPHSAYRGLQVPQNVRVVDLWNIL